MEMFVPLSNTIAFYLTHQSQTETKVMTTNTWGNCLYKDTLNGYKLLSYVFYPTIAALFDSNRPAVYTIPIYRRLPGRVTSEVNIAKMQMAAIFSLD